LISRQRKTMSSKNQPECAFYKKIGQSVLFLFIKIYMYMYLILRSNIYM